MVLSKNTSAHALVTSSTNSAGEVRIAEVLKSSIFWDITPCSPLLATCFLLVSFFAYFLTLKMETTYSSETSIDFLRTTRRDIPEDRNLR
jgi:hypothetical protein